MEKTIKKGFITGRNIEPITTPIQRPRQILELHGRLWMGCILLASDLLGLFVAILIALQARRLPGVVLDQYYRQIFILLALTLGIAFFRKGLYPAVGSNYVDELRDIVSSSSFAFLILIGVTFLLKTTSIYSRLMLFIIWILSLVLVPAGRYVVRRLFIRLNLWGEPVAVIGDLRRNLALAEYFTTNLQLGLRPVAVFRDEYFSQADSKSESLLSIEQIKGYASQMSLHTVLVLIDDLNSLDALIDRYRFVFQRIILVKGRNGSYALNSLKSLDLSDILGLQVMNNLLDFWAQVLKRILDVIGSFLGLLFLSPFLGLTILLLKLDSHGGAFYRQERLGRNGKIFSPLKFRTMYADSDQRLAEMLAHNPSMKQEWDSYQKLRNDPRVTGVGRFLRKFSLDEIPQLWNVLIGEMSLVGPRPMMPTQRELYGVHFKEYVQVAPGMTGLWQVSGRNDTTFARRAELDSEYIQRWSVWWDIYILVKTIKIVFWQQGAY
ncbi:MAG TPA: undecaprenyl-phosphate galactose phosphotransferase WbaP [Anaerolineales bacterium]|nr:undecaprenyl-phosphate galactose phosphotransferase WbaP [Anaerolineales bacterium]